MRIVIAPDKFKGSLSATQVAQAIARGLPRADPGIVLDLCPMADGGEGTVDALVDSTGGRRITHRVTGPLPEMKVSATFGVLGDGTTAVVEMSAASGLHLLRPEQHDPMATTTFGTGELLVAAASTPGVRRIVLGIGGSATVDGGIGCAQACGLPVLLEGGEPVSMTEPLCGRDMDDVIGIKHARGSPVERVEIFLASDVTNPLCGPQGAARVFGPQKGATPQMVESLDRMLEGLARRTGKVDEANRPGAGAAGGLGFAMMAYFGAALRSGFDVVAEAVGLRQRLAGANLCVTGEGRLDASSLHGKTPIGVARLCRELAVPCVAVVGSAGVGAERAIDQGLSAWLPICDGPMPLERAMRDAPGLIERSAEMLLRLVRLGRSWAVE
jgi:glycerate 2-kinase